MNNEFNTEALSPATKDAINDVRRTLMQARLSREIWWTIQGEHPRRKEIVRALNFYNSFFGALSPTTFIAYIAGLASLFDEHPKSISLKSVPGIETTEAFEDLWSKGRTLFRYRSKVIVHRDSNFLGKNFGGHLGLTPDGIQEVLEKSCRCFDTAVTRIRLDTIPRLSCEDDLLSLIADINRNYPANGATNQKVQA